jgi:nucleotide-binding universal stress UspA family protein
MNRSTLSDIWGPYSKSLAKPRRGLLAGLDFGAPAGRRKSCMRVSWAQGLHPCKGGEAEILVARIFQRPAQQRAPPGSDPQSCRLSRKTPMSIVCGTDFSDASARAVAVAARLAERMQQPLHVVHAVELGQDQLLQPAYAAVMSSVTNLLQEQADGARAQGLSVDTHVRPAPADQALFEIAEQAKARLIVVGAASHSRSKRELGSRADRIARQARVPVLVTRDEKPFEAWLRGERKLRVVLCADFSLSAEAAARWLDDFARIGPCEVTLVHLYWPPLQFQRLGLSGVRSFLDADADVTKTLTRDFSERMAGLSNIDDLKYRLEPNLGRLDARLAMLAVEENADLIVVGSHGRSATERLWEGSVCRGVLRMGHSSVVCVPLPASAAKARPARIKNVLVATDFSEVGNAAISLAYSLAPADASVHLVHVISGGSDGFEPHDIFEGRADNAQARSEAEARLRTLVPAGADGPRTLLHVLTSRRAAEAIAQAAERLDADLVCLGTHGRTGIRRVLLGSQAQAVLGNTRRPVLFARAPQA